MPDGRTSSGPRTRPELAVDTLLADRYRLQRLVSDSGPASLWRATDEVLARPVAVKVLPARGSDATPFLTAAVGTAALAAPGLVKVYDAAQEPGRAGSAYVISEWVDGQSLDALLLAEGPLSAVDAADLLRQAADALSAAHARGVLHGRVHPGNLLVTGSGRLRVTDATVAAVLHGQGAGSVRQDTQDLAAVLYALLTARWPAGATTQPGGGLPGAPAGEGRGWSPRQLRAGVPRSLDVVVGRALAPERHPSTPPLATPAALADAADRAVQDAREAQALADVPRPPGRLRRALPWLVSLAVLGAVGTAGWLLGLAVGDLPRRDLGVETIISTTSSPPPGASARPTPLDPIAIVPRDFDPDGDGQESPDLVRNAVDGDPSTAWATDRYNTSDLGGLKPGVGLLLDLGSVRPLTTVQVGLTTGGATVELRVADRVAAKEDGFRVVATATSAPSSTTLTPPAGTSARYVLVWFTRLPSSDGGFREGVSEIRVS